MFKYKIKDFFFYSIFCHVLLHIMITQLMFEYELKELKLVKIFGLDIGPPL